VSKGSNYSVLKNSTIVGSKIPIETRNELLSDYLNLMKEAILNGYEWEVPELGTLRFIRIVGNKKNINLGRRFFKIGYEWYMLDFTCYSSATQNKISYSALDVLKGQAKRNIKEKKLDYRVLL